MATSIDIDFGLDATSFTSGIAMVNKQTKAMSNAVERQIQALAKEYKQLQGGTSEYERYRAAQKGATEQQREQIEYLLKGIEAHRGLSEAQNENANTAFKLGEAIGTKLRMSIYAAVGGLAALGAASVKAFSVFSAEADRASTIYNKAFQLNVDSNQLQGFYYAAKKVGLSVDNVDDILKDINDKFGDMALNNSGELKDVFKNLGLSLDQFIGKDPITILRDINQASSKLTSAERANIFESMGNDLDFLKPLLAENAAALDANIAKAEKFGLVISGADLTAYNQFNSTLTDIGARFDGLRTQVFAGLAEPMKEAIVYVDKWIESLGGAEVLANTISNGLVNGIKMAVGAASWLGQAFYAIKPAIDMIVGGVALTVRGMLEAVEVAAKIPGSPLWALNKESGGQMLAGIQSAQSVMDGYIGQMKTLDKSSAHSAKRIEEIQNFSNGLIGALDAGQAKGNAQFEAKVKMPELEAKVTELSQALQAAQEQVKQAKNDPSASTEQVAAAITKLAEVTAQHQQAVEALGASRKGSAGVGQVDDGAYSKELQRQKQLEEERTKLLKQQQEQLKWRDKLNSDTAKITNSAAQTQQEASQKMESAVQNFDNTVNKTEKKNASPLALDNPQISLIKGKGWYNDHVDQDPTGQKYLRQAYPEYYRKSQSQSNKSPADNSMGEKGTGEKENLGTINISVVSESGVVKLFPVLGTVKTLQELKEAVESIMGQYARNGAMGNA